MAPGSKIAHLTCTLLDTYGGKSRLLLGFVLLLSSVPLVWTTNYTSLNATSDQLRVGDRLVSSPKHYFELGIFSLINSSSTNTYFLSIRYAPRFDQVVTWIANRDTPLSQQAVLQFDKGNLKFHDSTNANRDIWYTGTDNKDVVSATLLDSGKLVLMNKDGTEVWNSFNHSPPTDTLLPGQHMRRSEGHSLNSWQRTGNPAIANDTYRFGWDSKRVLTLSWTCPNCKLDWKGGSYIPAPDVYAAHTIQNVDDVYFHEDLGHLYIGSNPDTAILSGGPDSVSDTTLKRITMCRDGGLRILQYTINETVGSSNQTWNATANWVVSDRPDSRSQCTTFGTCGQFSMCISLIDSSNAVDCQCAGADNPDTKGWFRPIDGINATKGCTPQQGELTCTPENVNNTTTVMPYMMPLPGVDMPWGGDYETLRNLPRNSSDNCMQVCREDCYCAGAVYSEAEHTCWKKNGVLYNLGYPTEALHGTDRISFLKNQTVPDYPKPSAKDQELVKILLLAVGIPGILLIAVMIIWLWRQGRLQQWVPDWGSCFRRPPNYEIRFPGETTVQNEQGDRV